MAKRSRQASKRRKQPRSCKKPLHSVSVFTLGMELDKASPSETRSGDQHERAGTSRPPLLLGKWIAEASLDCGSTEDTHDDWDDAFFQRADDMGVEAATDLDSYPPVVEPSAPVPTLSPKVLARRNKYRKFVGVVVTIGILISVAGVGKSFFDRPVAAAQSSAEQPAKVVADVATSSQPIENSRIFHEAPMSSTEPDLSDNATEVAAVEKENDVYGDNPRGTALSLLNRGKMKEAIPAARAAIDKEPDHALGYLYLGTALQDTGQRKQALEAYSACVRTAQRGPVGECRAMGGKP